MKTLEGFSRRVWMFVAASVSYVVLLQGLHLVAELRSIERLEAETSARARLAATAVVAEGGPSLRRALDDWSKGAMPRRPSLPRSYFDQHAVLGVELLSADGWAIESRIGMQSEGSRRQLDDRQKRRLEAGETVVDLSGVGRDPVYAIATALQPVLSDDARLVGIVAVDVSGESLALARRQLRLGAAIEGGSLVLFALLLTLFMRWTLRPLELLARTTSGAPDLRVDDLARRDDTGFVIETHRRMIDQLRDKEQELRRLREVERDRADSLQELNASIVDSMASGVLILDLSGRVRTMNDVCRRMLGLSEERVRGRPVQEILRELPELQARLLSALEAGTVVARDEMRLSPRGLGRRDVDLSISPLRDAQGARTGAVCLVVDLTEMKRLQEEVRLKESLAELGELSAGIAHEFRNSLAAIMGFARLLERQGDEQSREHAAAITAECTQLRRVVDDFLRFANPTRLVIETVDLARLFADLADDARTRAGSKAVTYRVEPGLPIVSGDESLLRRAFGNLVRNAVDAVPDGGVVVVGSTPGEREVTIHVDDDGPGIPPEDRPRVFVPFFTRKESGTGLGLALVRKIVVHHGGRVGVEESPLGGARLSVTLPLRPAEAGG